MSKYKEPYEMTEQHMEFREHLIDELKARTGASLVNLIAYKERQNLEPYTIRETQITLELRVGNQLAKIIISEEQQGYAPNAMFYGMRDLGNRMMDTLIKAGAQAL